MLGFSNDFGISVYRTDGLGLRTVLFILNLTEFKCRLAMLSHFFMWHDMTVFLPEHYGRISYTYEPISDLPVVWFEQDWTVVH